MPRIPRQQPLAVQFHPGVGLERAAVGLDAQMQLRGKAATTQPAIQQQGLAQAGGFNRAVAAGDGGEAGQVLRGGQFRGAGRVSCAAPAQGFDGAAGAAVAEQGQ